MRHTPLLTFALAACDGTLGEQAGASLVSPSPYVMPDRSGCTYYFDRDEGVDGELDYSVEQSFDGQDRLATERVELAGLYVETSVWSYDGSGCLSSYDRALDMDPAVGDAYDSETHYTQTCDASGNVVEREGTYNNEPFTVAFENTYESDQLVAVSAVLRWASSGDVTVLGWTYSWEDGVKVGATSSVDGQLIEEEAWSWSEAGTLSAYTSTSLDSGEVISSYAYSYTYDRNGRQLTQTCSSPESGDLWQRRYSWYDDIYHTHATAYDLGVDGEDDQVLDYACGLRWPWNCLYTEDGDPDMGSLPDGEPDASGLVRWSCE